MKIRSCLFIFCLLTRFGYPQVFSDVGGGVMINGSPGSVSLLDTFQNQIFVRGSFNMVSSGQTIGNTIWNGTNYIISCPEEGGGPYSFCGYKDKVYAGGDFWSFCNILAYDLVRWNGTSWEKTDSNSTSEGNINDMVVYKDELYVAGSIVNFRGVNINRIAKFDGAIWSGVGGGITGGFQKVNCMAVMNDELYVGGDFSYAGGDTAYCIAKWNGMEWSEVGGGFNGSVLEMAADTVNKKLFVHGLFSEANYHDSKPISWIAEWDGVSWKSVGNPNDLPQPKCLEVYNGKLYAGLIDDNNPLTSEDTTLIRWDGQQWEIIGRSNNSILALRVFQDELYIGGGFDTLNGIPYNGIARYKDTLTTATPINLENEEFGIFKVYPNPFKKKIFIEFESISNEFEFLLLNASGKEVIKEKIKDKNGRKEFEIKNYADGIYFYKIRSGSGIFQTGKLLLKE